MENGEERSGAQSRVASATSARDKPDETELEDQQTEPTPSPSALVVIGSHRVFVVFCCI